MNRNDDPNWSVHHNGTIELHPVRVDRAYREHLIATGRIVPTTQGLYDPWYVRDLPALPLDDAGRRAVSRHDESRFDYAEDYH